MVLGGDVDTLPEHIILFTVSSPLLLTVPDNISKEALTLQVLFVMVRAGAKLHDVELLPLTVTPFNAPVPLHVNASV
jgi:hypothetical protein